jgi:DNA-directed RNA polymerase subunit RPC12/RpoP
LEFDSTLQKMKCPYCDSTFDVQALAYQDEALEATPSAEAAQSPAGTSATIVAGAAGLAAAGQQPAATAAPAAAVAAAAAVASTLPPPVGAAVALPPPPAAAQRVDWLMPSRSWAAEETDDMFVYTCSSCAGQLVSDATLGTSSCPYCGNPVTITERFAGDLKPDLVLPFQLSKDAAKAALKQHYQGKPFLPRRFTDESTISEVKGVYVPFWLFDATCLAEASFKCTTTRHYSDDDYDYTDTSHYSVRRNGVIEFLHVPVDGSMRLADDLMESIEPFDYSQMVPFQTAYLAGYSANIFDIDAPTAIIRAKQRMAESSEEVMRTSVQGYSSVDTDHFDLSYQDPRCLYALLPVWLLSIVFEGKAYTFAMNGQNGRFVGDLPIDKGRRLASFLKVAGVATAVIFVLLLLIGLLL